MVDTSSSSFRKHKVYRLELCMEGKVGHLHDMDVVVKRGHRFAVECNEIDTEEVEFHKAEGVGEQSAHKHN
ncbi:hypothetical protein G7Y89_g8057 [Cudoniella acicularis]|uniref:Uncharacterized protein n=1 Tax=Cudoniella acicularis TaxID=354080 RepID=A0A8H4RJL0_9HELO|nr:hypothetical protein G7Y89_g8057 [Cudoniella acicularis]